MKKVMSIGVKPLAMATALIAGTSASMIAAALPGGGDTLGAATVTTETTCQRSVDMTITGAARSVTTGTGTCQIRTLPPTVGFVVTDTAPAGATVADSGAMVAAGGELYEAYVGGNRDAAVLLTPNRALATSRAITFASGTGGSTAVDFAATVQPATALDAAWLTGTYRIMNRTHDYTSAASGLEQSNGVLNVGLSEFGYTKSTEVQFNGDGTCAVTDVDSHLMFTITKDPTLNMGLLEMDNGCTVGGGDCAQNDGGNYIMTGGINAGTTGLVPPYVDWTDANADGQSLFDAGCTYSVSGGAVTVNYDLAYGSTGVLPPDGGSIQWSTTYNVSADLRYIVADGVSATDAGGIAYQIPHKGGMAVGVRVGSPVVEGKTYLFNALDSYNTTSTPATASYEQPLTPTYQQEKCASRGSLTLSAAGACSYDVVSTCNARFKSGYEESAVGANDGTITDSVTVLDGLPVITSCSWSGTGASLVVDLGMQNQGGDPITMHYNGAASDNGEALVMQGIYNVFAVAPDTENPPLLSAQQYDMQSYMVAQEYTGDLNANADADEYTNYDEFTYATDITPATGTVKNDYNNDQASDMMFSRTSDGQLQSWIVDPATGTTVLSKTWVTLLGAPWSAISSGDFNGDGAAEMLYQNTTTGQLQVMTYGAGGNTLASKYWFGSALAPATNWVVKGVADFNGDGNTDVLYQRTTDGQVQIWLTSADGLTNTTKAWVASRSTNWVIKGIGDLNADGRADVVWRNNDNGQMAAWIMAAGGLTIQTNAWLPEAVTDASGWVYKGLSDTDGDKGQDLLFQRSSDGMVMVWAMNADGITRTAKTWIAGIASAWAIRDTGTDYNADGRGDILFVNPTTGQNQVWLIGADGVSKQAAAWIGTALLGWDYKPANSL